MARYAIGGPAGGSMRDASPIRWLSRAEAEAIYPRADRDWYNPLVPDLHVSEHQPIDTGLVDVRGRCILRNPYPMGFGRDAEW